MCEISPKSILETYDVDCSRQEIQAFVDEIRTHLKFRYLGMAGLNETCVRHGCGLCGGSGQSLDAIPLVETCPGEESFNG